MTSSSVKELKMSTVESTVGVHETDVEHAVRQFITLREISFVKQNHQNSLMLKEKIQ